MGRMIKEKGPYMASPCISPTVGNVHGRPLLLLSTAGSPWLRLSSEEVRENRMQEHVELLAAARKLAHKAKALGVKIVWEWPTPCGLWKTDLFKQLELELGLCRVKICGCSFGLWAQNPKDLGELVCKFASYDGPWHSYNGFLRLDFGIRRSWGDRAVPTQRMPLLSDQTCSLRGQRHEAFRKVYSHVGSGLLGVRS